MTKYDPHATVAPAEDGAFVTVTIWVPLEEINIEG